jgi:4TM region of DNA translocase FtsK/SpoIIIE
MAIESAPPASEQRALDGFAVVALGLGCFLGVIVVLPPEGRIAGPLHEGVGHLLGHFSFLLPLGLMGLGVVALAPGLVRRSRLVGIGLVLVAALPASHLHGLGSGLAGEWLGNVLLDALGGPGTTVVLLASLAVGVLLALDVSLVQIARRWSVTRRVAEE